MGPAIRVLLAVWFFMIFGFCVYGFLVTYAMPGETFCRAMYTAMTALFMLCINQVRTHAPGKLIVDGIDRPGSSADRSRPSSVDSMAKRSVLVR